MSEIRKNEDCKNEAEAVTLLAEYSELYSQKVDLEDRLRKLREKAAKELCVYKIGMEFIDSHGVRYVLTKIEPSTYTMQGGFGNRNIPYISFNYTFRRVRKDGCLSINNAYTNPDTSTFTGKIWNLEQ